MNKKYIYLLIVTDDELDHEICSIEAFSWESLEEQKHKIDVAKQRYEENKFNEIDGLNRFSEDA